MGDSACLELLHLPGFIDNLTSHAEAPEDEIWIWPRNIHELHP